MVSKATKTTRLIQLFGITKVPMIWYCRPKVIEHTDEKIEIKIPLKRKTKNHLGSMYFGVLAVGADITGGFLAMDPIFQFLEFSKKIENFREKIAIFATRFFRF